MKRVLIFFLFLIFINEVLASVKVNDYTFNNSYVPKENIAGKIDLTIKNEEIDSELTSNRGDKIVFKDFLDLNNAEYFCYPNDCLKNYNVLSGSEEESFTISFDEDVYIGFVLKGNNVEISQIYFSAQSNFYSSTENPLKINFFEENLWEYDKFSKENFNLKKWGCFDDKESVIGPFIRTASYCELIYLSETNSIFAGTLVDKEDNKGLKMSVYTEQGYFIGDCSFNPLIDDGCKVNADKGEVFPAGKYQVCVGAVHPTDYHIYEESKGVNCGFVYSAGPESSTKDYGIFARTAKYADSSSFNSQDINFEDYIAGANYIISQRYDGNCSAGCVLPLVISGIPQNLRIDNIIIDYSKEGEDYIERKIYKIEPVSALVNFDGILDLELTGFKANSEGKYKIYFGDKRLFEEEIELLPAPIINSFYPLNPPAGIPITFYVDVEFEGSLESLEYKWDFDGEVLRTKTNYVIYAFPEIKDYPVSVEVTKGNLTSKKSFLVETISPRDAVNFLLIQRKKSLEQIISYIDGLSEWYKEELKRKLNISIYEEILDNLEQEGDKAVSDNDFLEIAKEIYSFDFYKEIYTESGVIPIFVTQMSDINPEAVAIISKETLPYNPDDYKEQIIAWQRQNIDVNSEYKKIVFTRESGRQEVFRYFVINLKSNSDEESFFVINAPKEKLSFKDGSEIKSVGGSSGISLSGNERKVVEFYYFDSEEISFFVSPKLSSILTEEDINKSCNFNLVCEPESGENWENCRSDCKPRSRALFYFIIGLLIMLVVYILMQLWYKKHYEDYLFGKDRSQIYNLLMFVANARARGIKDSQIIKSLKQQGWNSEKIRYIIKKSYGKNVGMIEVIPFSRISSFIRNRKAKRNAGVQNNYIGRPSDFNS